MRRKAIVVGAVLRDRSGKHKAVVKRVGAESVVLDVHSGRKVTRATLPMSYMASPVCGWSLTREGRGEGDEP